MQCAVNRARVGDLQEPRTLLFVERAIEGDLALDVVEFAGPCLSRRADFVDEAVDLRLELGRLLGER